MAGGCQVDFYLLGSSDQDDRALACKLALMAWERGHEVCIIAADAGQARALDELMWEAPADRFLPHERSRQAGDSAAPVEILDQAPGGAADVVINMTARALDGAREYRRLLEIVPHHEAQREASRDKYRRYAAMGIQPASHEI